ncbi:MAG: hypothetical protein AAFR60_09230, partial [Pseudomonadota bacterium]
TFASSVGAYWPNVRKLRWRVLARRSQAPLARAIRALGQFWNSFDAHKQRLCPENYFHNLK